MNQIIHLQRNQDLFANLPFEIIIEILSRLPVETIISCKFVCKAWLTLLNSHLFAKLHLLRSIPGLAVHMVNSDLCKFFEFEDGLNLEHLGLHYKSVTKFNFPDREGSINGSVNGLLFLCGIGTHPALHICNPITRDYIQLDCNEFVNSGGLVVTYGFGLSKITGQYKVVRIFQGFTPNEPPRFVVPNLECVCHVYTIGTGLWRRISHVSGLVHRRENIGAFLNGNLHWPVSDFEGPQLLISCFDLETEHFSTFSSPLLQTTHSVGPTILGGCLCLYDGIAIWLMKEYGVEESWTKQFFIADARPLEAQFIFIDAVYPIKVFKDGDILLVWENDFLFFSKKNNTVQELETIEPHAGINAILYTPSFLSLKNFGMEKWWLRPTGLNRRNANSSMNNFIQ